MSTYTEDDFLDEMAKECRNCGCCQQVPCPGCASGGMCDAFDCVLDDHDGQFEDEEDIDTGAA